MNNAIIAMSGGVDSSVAAFLMKDKGYDLRGVTLSLYNESERDIRDAKSICDNLGFSHTTLNMKEEFTREVIEEFIKAYENSRTPNPCVVCNKRIKFGKLLDYTLGEGYNFLATGHYAQVEKIGDRYILKKGKDTRKDQSYMLYSLSQHQLSHIILPLGGLSKDEVREIAEGNNLVTARKSDSQDICFVPEGKYAEFIENYLGKTYPEGDFVDLEGKVWGTHKGLIRYTVGQRKGLGLALPKPMYVCKLDPKNNAVILGDNEDLFKSELVAGDINFITCDKLSAPIKCEAKVRYSQSQQPATVWQTGENEIRVEFNEPQRAITPGQAVVLYDGDTVIGGGTIR